MVKARRMWWCVAILMAVGTGGLAGCGGGTTKADFVKEADAACRSTDTTLTGIAKPRDLSSLATESEKLATANDQQVVAVRKLDMPGGDDKKRAETVLADLGAVTPAARNVEAKARASDLAAGPAVTEAKAKAQTASDAARAYGFTVCGAGVQKASVAVAEGARPALKKEWVTKAEALCAVFSDKVNGLRRPTSASGLDAYGNAFVGAINDFTSGLEVLPAPPGDEAVVADIIVSVEKLVPVFERVVAAAKTGNESEAANRQKELDQAGKASDAKSTAYGLGDCG